MTERWVWNDDVKAAQRELAAAVDKLTRLVVKQKQEQGEYDSETDGDGTIEQQLDGCVMSGAVVGVQYQFMTGDVSDSMTFAVNTGDVTRNTAAGLADFAKRTFQ